MKFTSNNVPRIKEQWSDLGGGLYEYWSDGSLYYCKSGVKVMVVEPFYKDAISIILNNRYISLQLESSQ